MKTVCMECGREQVAGGRRADASDTKVSHNICSRCMVFQKGADYDLTNDRDRGDLKRTIQWELDNMVEWEGGYKIARPLEEERMYQELVAEALREREGGIGRKR